MRILVTGSSGFIGTWLCESLAKAHSLIGLDVREPRTRVENVSYNLGDILDREQVTAAVRRVAPEAIIHLAAQARIEPSFEDPIATYDANVLGTINLVRAALALGAELGKFVYVSSETVYGPVTVYPTPEEARVIPQSPYAASKAASEHLVRATLLGRSLVLRSGMCYGPRSNPNVQVVARFIERALRDEPLMFPASLPVADHPSRDLNYVSNLIDGIRLALDADATGVFNIAGGNEVSMLDLAKRVVDRVGSGRVEFSPKYRYRRGEEGLRTWLDISKARMEFGYSPQVGLDDGLDQTIRWMRSHQ